MMKCNGNNPNCLVCWAKEDNDNCPNGCNDDGDEEVWS